MVVAEEIVMAATSRRRGEKEERRREEEEKRIRVESTWRREDGIRVEEKGHSGDVTAVF